MSKIAIVLHSGHGHTKQVAQAAAEGRAGLRTATPSDASTHQLMHGDIATARAFGERTMSVAAGEAA